MAFDLPDLPKITGAAVDTLVEHLQSALKHCHAIQRQAFLSVTMTDPTVVHDGAKRVSTALSHAKAAKRAADGLASEMRYLTNGRTGRDRSVCEDLRERLGWIVAGLASGTVRGQSTKRPDMLTDWRRRFGYALVCNGWSDARLKALFDFVLRSHDVAVAKDRSRYLTDKDNRRPRGS